MQDGTTNYVLKMWRIALRNLYSMGGVTRDEFISCFDKSFLGKEPLTARESDIVESVNVIMSDSGSFTVLVKQDIDWITRGVIPEKSSFSDMWMSALLECKEDAFLEPSEFDPLCDTIDFSVDEWLDGEMDTVNMVLDKLRMSILKKNPSAFEFMDNPSFDVLMYMNGMSTI